MVDTLSSYLQALQEEGGGTVEVLADTLALLTLPRLRPRPPAPEKSARAPIPVPRPVRSSAATPLKQVICRRLSICQDSPEQAGMQIRLVAAESNFKGDAGRLLLQMLTAMGYEPIARGTSFEPDAVFEWNLALGPEALDALLGKSTSLIMMRGKLLSSARGAVLATLGPVSVGENRDSKRTVWGDLQTLIKQMGLSLPPKT